MACAQLTGLASLHPGYAPLQLIDATCEEWVDNELAQRRKLTAWEAVVAGLTLGLPTYSEYAARVAAIERGAQLAEAQQEEARQAYRTGRRPKALAT